MGAFPRRVTPIQRGASCAMFFRLTTNWTVPYAGWYRVAAIGAGGGGAAFAGNDTTGGCASGGGGGGLCEKTVFLNAGDVLRITIPAAVAGGSSTGASNVGGNGTDGGDAIVTGPRINLFAGGGKGGAASTGGSQTGALGGVAWGGDWNSAGGNGGDCSETGASVAASGGGSCGLPAGIRSFGTYQGGSGGSAAVTASGFVVGTGGGSVYGFDGPAVSTAVNSNNGSGAGCGGGNTRARMDSSTFNLPHSLNSLDGHVRTQPSTSSLAFGFESFQDPLRYFSAGGGGVVITNNGPGAGGFVNDPRAGLQGSMLGGGGAFALVSGTATALQPLIGGGGGGSVTKTTGTCTGGSSGRGIAIVERVAEPRESSPFKKVVYCRQTALFFIADTTYTVPYDGFYRLSVIGGGGAGGCGAAAAGTRQAGGGGGGGFSQKETWLTARTVLNIKIGARGASATVAVGADGAATGGDGGTTSILGGGISIFATGGTGGAATITNSTASGGLAGAGRGGDINYKGGDGGSGPGQASGMRSGGGGACGSPSGAGGNGGSAAAATPNRNGGGGAVGGFVGSSTSGAIGTGAGTGGNATTAISGTSRLGYDPVSICADGELRNSAGQFTKQGLESLSHPLFQMNGSGSATPCVGAGTQSASSITGPTTITGAVGGIFGGHCGNLGGTGGIDMSAAFALIGSGSGGLCNSAPVTNQNASAQGGSGLAVIERIG